MKKKTFWILFGLILFLASFLRLYGLNKFPPALYWEEVALGYDAYSILKTGADHHGNFMPLVAFESFGDWKPSLYFYVLVPFIKFFGLTEFGVRLPAAFSGILLVLGVGILAREFFGQKNQDWAQLIAMGVATLSPWAIIFSRAAWEVNLATALILWGVILFLQALKSKQYQGCFLIGSAFLLTLSMYAYHSARIVAPFLGLGLGFLWLKKTHFNWLKLFFPGLVALVLLIPLFFSLGKTTTTQRFAETSIFSNLEVIKESNLRKDRAGSTWVSKIIYHRYVLFSQEILSNFLTHFRLDFLFVSGDVNPRHSVWYFGQLYHLEIIFLCLGSYALFKQKNKYAWFLLWWLVIGIFPAALTKTTPHALRILPTLPVWLILITLGINEALEIGKKYKKPLSFLILITYLVEGGFFWRFYTKVYPQLYGQEWQVGYKAMIAEVKKEKLANPDKIIHVSRAKGRPAMYYWFYTQTDPRKVQAENETAAKDQGEFLEFENLRFE